MYASSYLLEVIVITLLIITLFYHIINYDNVFNQKFFSGQDDKLLSIHLAINLYNSICTYIHIHIGILVHNSVYFHILTKNLMRIQDLSRLAYTFLTYSSSIQIRNKQDSLQLIKSAIFAKTNI